MEPLLTVSQVAELVKLAPPTVRQALRTGELNGTKLGNRWRVPPADVTAWIEAGRPVLSPPFVSGPRPQPWTPRGRTQLPPGGARQLVKERLARERAAREREAQKRKR